MKERNILRIRLGEAEYEKEPVENRYLNLGGRGLTSNIIAEEVPPDCDPLGAENKLVIAAGILAGTSVPNSGRLSIGAKSPLTRTIKEANAGGTAARKLARLRIQALVMEGCAKEPTTVVVSRDGVTFLPAADFSGLMISDCIARLRAEHGDGAGIICVGPAGELKLNAAAIAVTSPDFYPRIAGRGGLGAVMGAKNVKAVVIDDAGSKPVAIKDAALFKRSVNSFTKGITAHPLVEGLRLFGTPVLVGLINEMGAIPTKNFSEGRFEGAGKLGGERLAELIKTRPNAVGAHRCMEGCVISCSNVYTDEAGEVVVSGMEYETLALMGTNCMIDDMDIIAKMNGICNDVGIDTMETGAAVAVAMEGGVLDWGDGPAALALVEEIAKGTERGRMIGNGCRFTGETLGVSRIPHVKGQALSGYDPRGLKGTGVTYATSPMGADHTCGNALPSPANPDYSPVTAKGQGAMSRFLQTYMAAVDTLGLCLFASLPVLDMPELKSALIECTAGVLDDALDEEYLERLGQMVLRTERKYNDAAGFTRADDRLPEFFVKTALPTNQQVFDVSEEELDAVNPLK